MAYNRALVYTQVTYYGNDGEITISVTTRKYSQVQGVK